MTEITKRSVVLRGRRTAVSLEDPFWKELRRIARALEYKSVQDLIAEIDFNNRKRSNGSTPQLSNALRLFIFEDVMARATGAASPALAATEMETLQ